MNFSFRPLWMKAAVASAAVATTTLLSASMASAQTVVDLELFLAVDVSGSVDTTEFNLQKVGYVQAFQDAAVQAAIISKPNGVAVALGQWASSAAATPAVGWSLLKTAGDANAFAAAINAMTRNNSIGGSTCVACGINEAVSELQGNAYTGPGVIDVSGDGEDNVVGTAATAAARTNAFNLGFKINGLPILTDDPNLDVWYQANVQTTNGFTQVANNFNDFDTAVQAKIVREITGGDTVPGPLPILGAGVAFGFSRRLRKRINLATLA